ncbi:hypothetical protein ACJVDH_10680 [Pedobacter sp. AW1-32]|uniref:hypothetical protein n=1 Tax=Pedobacter sp. AW1-32 TaxID=3383026 RepID=UPI003FEF3F5A
MNKNITIQNTLKLFVATLVALFVFDSAALAQNNEMDLGLRIGMGRSNIKTGISGRYFLDKDVAVEGILSLSGSGGVALFGQKYFPIDNGLRFFAGGGAYLGFSSRNLLGISGMAGIEYQFEEYPLSVSFDWKPELNLIDHARFNGVPVALTARYRINW